jgi:hypothetical protein
MDAWADGANDDGRGRLEDDVRDKEDEVADILEIVRVNKDLILRVIQALEMTDVAISCEFQLKSHAGDGGGAHVGAIHETDAVHGANSDDQTTINAPDYLPLFLFGEAMVDVFMVLFMGQLSRTVVAELVLLLELTG